MGWLVALIEIVTTAALGFFGVEVKHAELCIEAAADVRTVEYVSHPYQAEWAPAAYVNEPPAAPCPVESDLPLPEAEPVFLIEI